MVSETGLVMPSALDGGADPRNDVFNRLMKNRVVLLGSDVNDDIANQLCAQLLYLEGEDPNTGELTTTNLARIPGTDLPVSINSVNSGTQGGYIGSNVLYCSEEFNGSLDYSSFFNEAPVSSPPVYNGFTDVFVAKSAVVPCQPYRMTLVIADVGDALWDSGIFFEANSFCSFTGGHNATQELTVTEDCAPQELELDISSFPPEEYPLTYAITGTATASEDFADIPLSGTISELAESWSLAAGIINDDVAESNEQLEVSISGSSCRTQTFLINIVDPILIEGPELASCEGDPITLTATDNPLLLEQYEFSWSDGQTGPGITVNPSQTTTYTLTYSNGSSECTADFTVTVSPQETELQATINEGEAYTLGGESFTAAGTYELNFTSEAGCDSLVRLDLRLNTVPSTLTDSIAVGQTVDRCIDTQSLQQLSSFSNSCTPQGIDLQLDPATACVQYTGTTPGLSEACLIACSPNGTCDTTYLQIRVFDNILDAVDDYDTTRYDQPATIDVLANDWTELTVLTDQYIVSSPAYGSLQLNGDGTIAYSPELEACLLQDEFSYAICNEFGCDTATVFLFLEDTEGACGLVWPGDVGNDGTVNQMDQWAIGLAYGTTGPVRPNATIEWIGQPAIDWPSTLTFAYEFNNKYTDCNGDGLISEDDMEAIQLNWGKVHGLAPQPVFPNRLLPQKARLTAAEGAQQHLDIELGTVAQPAPDAYGFSLKAHFDPTKVSSLQFTTDGSWLGTEGQDMLVLQKVDYEMGEAVISLVRTDQQGREGYGSIAGLELYCPQGDCGSLTLSDWQLLQSDADVFEIGSPYEWSAGLTSASEVVAAQLRLFPNPVRQELIVQSPADAPARLLNASGSTAWEGQIRSGQQSIDLSGLPGGLYLLQLQVGDELIHRKVVKQ